MRQPEYRRGGGSYLQAASRALQKEQTRDSPQPSSTGGGSSSDDTPPSSGSSPWKAGTHGSPFARRHWTCRGHQSCGYRHNHPLQASCTACGRFWTRAGPPNKTQTSSGSAGSQRGGPSAPPHAGRPRKPLTEEHWKERSGKGKGHGHGSSQPPNPWHLQPWPVATPAAQPQPEQIPSTPARVDDFDSEEQLAKARRAAKPNCAGCVTWRRTSRSWSRTAENSGN